MPGRLILPRETRLLKGGEFRQVFDQRRAVSNELFRIHFADAEQPRLGMAVSRRVSPRAVVRNRIRRQVRESFRLTRNRLTALDFVVLAKPAAAAADRHRLRQAINQLWQRFIEKQP